MASETSKPDLVYPQSQDCVTVVIGNAVLPNHNLVRNRLSLGQNNPRSMGVGGLGGLPGLYPIYTRRLGAARSNTAAQMQ